jgi:hypothetical protein
MAAPDVCRRSVGVSYEAKSLYASNLYKEMKDSRETTQ